MLKRPRILLLWNWAAELLIWKIPVVVRIKGWPESSQPRRGTLWAVARSPHPAAHPAAPCLGTAPAEPQLCTPASAEQGAHNPTAALQIHSGIVERGLKLSLHLLRSNSPEGISNARTTLSYTHNYLEARTNLSSKTSKPPPTPLIYGTEEPDTQQPPIQNQALQIHWHFWKVKSQIPLLGSPGEFCRRVPFAPLPVAKHPPPPSSAEGYPVRALGRRLDRQSRLGRCRSHFVRWRHTFHGVVSALWKIYR